MKRSYNPVGTRIRGVELVGGFPDQETIPVPLGATRVRMLGTGDSYRAHFEPAIVGVYVFRGDLGPGVSPWVERGALSTLTVDLTADSGFSGRSGRALAGFPEQAYLYVGFAAPLVTELHIEMESGSVNDEPSSSAVQAWVGDRWSNLTKTADTTEVNTVALAQSGYIQWEQEVRWRPSVINPELPPSELPAGGAPVCYWVRVLWSESLGLGPVVNKLWSAMTGSVALVGGYFTAGVEYELDLARYMVRGLSFKGGETDVTLRATFLVDESTLWGTGDICPPGIPPRRTRNSIPIRSIREAERLRTPLPFPWPPPWIDPTPQPAFPGDPYGMNRLMQGWGNLAGMDTGSFVERKAAMQGMAAIDPRELAIHHRMPWWVTRPWDLACEEEE